MERHKNKQKAHNKRSASAHILQDDLRKVGEAVVQTAFDAKDSAGNLIDDAKDKAGDMVDDARKHAAELQHSAVNYVKAHPLKSVGYAALAGFLVALLVRGK